MVEGIVLPPAALDADVEPSGTPPAPSPLTRVVLAAGSAGLLGAIATDALAVAGRHAGIRVLGAIELVQACIVVVATSSILLATLVDAHALVHILLERLSPAASARILRLADAASALVFLWIAAGSAWLAADLWHAFELTEILQIPLRWFRLLWILGATAAACVFAWRAIRGRRA